MKFMHLADLHLDTPFKGMRQQLGSRQQLLIDAPYRSFERLVDAAIQASVDCVLIVGDIYNADQQTIYAQHFFYQQMKKLEAAEIPVYLSYGNHDYQSSGQVRTNYPSNVHVFEEESVSHFDLTLADGKKARIYGFSYLHQWINERKVLEFPRPDARIDYHVGMLHGEVEAEGSKAGNYAPFSIEELKNRPYDYWALGHIHQAQRLNQSPLAQYAGTPQGRHRTETGDKGGYLVELRPKQPPLVEFISAAQIRWEIKDLECQETWSAAELVEAMDALLKGYQVLSEDSRQSYLISIQLTESQRLDRELKDQIEAGELLQTLTLIETRDYFIQCIRIKLISNAWKEAFDYDPVLNQSFQAAQAQVEANAYDEVMNGLYGHSIVSQYLPTYAQDEAFKEDLIQGAVNLVVESIGMED